VSPSLWRDNHRLLDERRQPGANLHYRDVYLAFGEREDDPSRSWSLVPPETVEAMAGINVVADAAAFAEQLRRHPHIDIRTEVIPDERHATVWPAAFTGGLVHLYRTDRP
jgi:hypothetical protein